MFLFSALAIDGGVMVGTIPSAVYRSKNGGWEELEGVRLHSAGANFPPSPELQSRTRYLTFDPENKNRLYAGIEVGGMVLSDDGGRGWEPATKVSPTWTSTRSSPPSSTAGHGLSRLRRSLLSQSRPRRPLGKYFAEKS